MCLNPLINEIYDRNLQGVSDLMDLCQSDILVTALYMPHIASINMGELSDFYHRYMTGELQFPENFGKTWSKTDEEVLYYMIDYVCTVRQIAVELKRHSVRLSLNMPFAEIDDPRGLCKDVTNLGRWGNGDIEVGLDNVEDIPHIMALVTQVFERQMGSDEI